MSKYGVKYTSTYKPSEVTNMRQWKPRIATTSILHCHTLIIIIKKDTITINSCFEFYVLPTSVFIPEFISQIHFKICGKRKVFITQSVVANIRHWKPRIASNGILLCHTLIIIIKKDIITINSCFELFVLPTSAFIPEFISQIHVKIYEKKKYL